MSLKNAKKDHGMLEKTKRDCPRKHRVRGARKDAKGRSRRTEPMVSAEEEAHGYSTL